MGDSDDFRQVKVHKDVVQILHSLKHYNGCSSLSDVIEFLLQDKGVKMEVCGECGTVIPRIEKRK